jgi:hypothetical protein
VREGWPQAFKAIAVNNRISRAALFINESPS